MKQKSIIGWVAAIVLLIAAIFLFANRQSVAKEKEMYKTESTKLQEQFNNLMVDFEKLKSENQDYVEMLQEKDSIIYANAEQIRSLLARARAADNYYSLKKRYDALEEEYNAYKSSIEALRAENERLQAENEEVKIELLEEKTLKNQLQTENEELSGKVELAKILRARDLEVTPMRLKSCGSKWIPTKYSSKLQRIQAEFILDENRVATPGVKTVFLRVHAPNNKVLRNVQSDEFTFEAADGNVLEYTAKQDIEFSGNTRNVKILWNKNEEIGLGKGFYRVSIYCEGYEIGKSRFELK